MNIKHFGILVILIITAVIISIFVMTIANEKAHVSITPRPVTAPTKETGAAEARRGIPTNTIPTPRELEDSVKKAHEMRVRYESLRQEMEKERVKRRAERDTLPQQRQLAEGKTKERTTLPEKKEIILPSLQKREEMASKGVISF